MLGSFRTSCPSGAASSSLLLLLLLLLSLLLVLLLLVLVLLLLLLLLLLSLSSSLLSLVMSPLATIVAAVELSPVLGEGWLVSSFRWENEGL